jgi:hypothetical protein
LKRLTTQQFIERAISVHGDRYDYFLADYIGSKIKVKIICSVHGEFLQQPGNHLSGRGCTICGENYPLTNEIVDKLIINKNIERIGNYINNKIKIDFKCLINNCFHIWSAAPSSIINNNSGCPACSGHLSLTNEIIDQRLCERNIKRIENYITDSTNIKISFQCLISSCLYVWGATPNNILNNNSGCPQCAGVVKLTNETVDRRLINRNIKRINCYTNNATKINFQCLINSCNYIWKAMPTDVLNGETGCPKCSGNLSLNNEIIDQRLYGRNIKRLGDYINARKSINFQCLIKGCEHIWMSTPDSILNSKKSGCPKCSRSISKMEVDWLDALHMSAECRQKSIKINDKNHRVDAYDPLTNTIYEFYGDFWHGNPNKYNLDDINCVSHKTYKQLYDRTMLKEKIYKEAGYNLITVWESDYILSIK